MLSTPSAHPVPVLRTREFINRNSAFKRFYKTEIVLSQLDACNNLGPLGIYIIKEKEKIIFQQISVTAVALLRFFRDTSSGATDKIVLEKPLPPLETNAAAVHPYMDNIGMTYEKYLNIANNYLKSDHLNLFIDEQATKSPTMRLYAYRDYYRDAYALFEYCELLLKKMHDSAYAIEADRYPSRLFNPLVIAEENIRIQDCATQQLNELTRNFLTTRSLEEKKSELYEIPKDLPFDLAGRFFNGEVISYKAEYNMQISETNPIEAFKMHCEAYTDIQLSALFLLKFIDFYAGCALLKRKSPEDAATLMRYFSEYKIPEAEMIYDGASDKNATMLSLNLLPQGTTPVITNKIKLTLKIDVIIIHVTKVIMTFKSEQRSEILQNLFEQAENILYVHSALYKEFYMEGIELNSKGNIIKPLDTIGSVTSDSKKLYSAIPIPINMLMDPVKLSQRIDCLKSNTVFQEFFNMPFVVSEIMTLRTLTLEKALEKERIIYSNIMLGAAYVMRHLDQVTLGDLDKISHNPAPAIYKLWEENPDHVDKMAWVMLNLPALEYQIVNNKRENTRDMLLKLRDYYRGAYTLYQYTEIVLREFKGQARECELEEFVRKRVLLNELQEQNKKIGIIARQRDTQNRKGKNTRETKNAYRESDPIVTSKINVINDFFNKDKIHKAIDGVESDFTAVKSNAALLAEVNTTSILASLFIMKLLDSLSGNIILHTFYKTKVEETLFYFSAYRIPDAAFESIKTGCDHRLVIVSNPDQSKIISIIISALNFDTITTEISRILKFPEVEIRNIEFKSLYDQAAKMFHNFDLNYKSRHIFRDLDVRTDDSILEPMHFQPVLTLSSFTMPESTEEKKKETKVAKSVAKTLRRVSEEKRKDVISKPEKPEPKVLSAAEIIKGASHEFAQTARKWQSDIPPLLVSAQKKYAELRRRNAKLIIPEKQDSPDAKLFKEITDVKSLVLGLGVSIDSLTAKHTDLLIPDVTPSELLTEVTSNRDTLKQVCTDCEKLFNEARSLDTSISSLDERINKITQKLQHQSSNSIVSTNTASIKQKLQDRQEQKEVEKRVAAERKKKLEEEKKTKEPKKKITVPPMAAVVALPGKSVKLFSVTSAKEHKKAPTFNPFREKRILHMDEACQSLIFINKIFEHYSGMNSDVMHFSLLYNIFRCFLALKTYQECGGRQSEELDVDIIKELRHMIIHHGGRAVDNVQVLSFAEDIRKKIPSALLKLKKPHQWKSELNSSQCSDLMEEFGLIPSGVEKLRNPDPFSKVLDDTPFYKQLRQFHEAKLENEVGLEDQDLVLTIYIPLMKSIIVSFQKQADYKTNENLFLQSYLFELQALSMLAALCGEVSLGFPVLDYRLTDFLSECYLIRNQVGHELYDLDKLTFFAKRIEIKISHVNLQKLSEIKDDPKPSSLPLGRRLG